jgi:kinesin family protein C1
MRKGHAKEVMELEMDLQRKEREARQVAEHLDSEREQAMLKGSVAQQATAQIALTSQNTVLQAQVSALQSQIDDYPRTISDQSRLEKRSRR